MNERIELFKNGGAWQAYFKDVAGMPREVIQTPFVDTTPFSIVKDVIQKKNPSCLVLNISSEVSKFLRSEMTAISLNELTEIFSD